ncbi:MAG: hypothetical protein AAGH90_04890 [Pseudomonadota bacterium]
MMPDWVIDIRDELSRELEMRYELLVRWVENWTLNDKIFWASISTILVVGVVVILNITKGSRLGAFRYVTSLCAIICLGVYTIGVLGNMEAGAMSYIFDY